MFGIAAKVDSFPNFRHTSLCHPSFKFVTFTTKSLCFNVSDGLQGTTANLLGWPKHLVQDATFF